MILTLGSRGPAVLTLQNALKARSHDAGASDGIFGKKTEAAVKSFQAAAGLAVDGKAGPKTLGAMGISPLEPESDLSKLKKGDADWYREAYRVCGFDPGMEDEVERDADLVFRGFARYSAITAATGVPEWYIGCTHFKEASCDFRAILHNGQRIVGTGQKSTIVPIGVGPFATFEEAAIHALRHDGLDKNKDWSVGNALRLAERYNGTGYLRYHPEENSPYLWARTTLNDGFGKYVRDGVWDANAPTNKTTGFAAIMKSLELRGKLTISS